MRGMKRDMKKMKLIPACCIALVILFACACNSENEAERAARSMTGGDPHRGRAALTRYGCSTCHTIPGVRGAPALVGPPLDRIASRSYIAGVLTNTPDHMIRW